MKGILTFKFKHKKPLLVELLENKDKEIEILKENNENMQIEMASCWEKIDKAIEYIENCSGIYSNVLGENKEMISSQNVLNILKGVDKE